MPPFLPIGDYAVYDALTPRALALVEPIAHGPWFGAAPALSSAALAAVVMATLWLAARRAGGGIAAAVLCAAVLSRADLRVPLALGAEPAIGIGLTWAAALLLAGEGFGSRAVVWGAALVAAAVACWPPLVVVAPALAVLAFSRRMAAGAVFGAAALGLAGGAALWAARAGALNNEPVSILEAAMVLVAADPRGGDPFVWPRLTAVALPGALAVVGALALAQRLPLRQRAGLALAAMVPVLAALALPSWRGEIVRAALWTSWPVMAAGIAWAAGQAPARQSPLVDGGAGRGAGRRRAVSVDARRRGRRPARVRARSGRRSSPIVAAAPSTVVAEDTRVDTALVAWGASAGSPARRPVPRLVDDALASGRTVLAGPSARTALELWGFRFTTAGATRCAGRFSVAAISGRLHCVPVAQPWRELPGLEYTGRLGLHLPAGTGQLEWRSSGRRRWRRG